MHVYWEHVKNGLVAFYGGSSDVQISGSLVIIFFSVGLVFYHILLTCEEPHMVCYSVALTAGISGIGTIFWTLFSPLPNMEIQLGFTNTGVFTIVGVIVMSLSAIGYAHFEEAEQDKDDEPETVTIPRSRFRGYDTFAPRPPLIPTKTLQPPQLKRVRTASTPLDISKPMTRTKSAPVLVSM